MSTLYIPVDVSSDKVPVKVVDGLLARATVTLWLEPTALDNVFARLFEKESLA